jgi:hypothetical protein
MFYILCNTLTPTNRPNSINGIVGNALLAISPGIRFDVPDLFIRNLACAADSPQSLKPYAPWIMFAIEQLINEKFIWAHFPKMFMPPVRDTLRMVKDIGKGKKPVDAPGTASASENAPKVKKARVESPHEENPSLYEICIRTPQALESHIKLDQKEKLELMTELNLLHNHTRQILLYEKEAKNHSWTLLRQHYSRKQLHAKGIKKEYDYLELIVVPRVRRQTPVLPQHSASTDLLFVGHDDEISDTACSLIYKPDVHRTKPSRAHAATPAFASTIPRSSDSDSSSGFNFDSEDTPEE